MRVASLLKAAPLCLAAAFSFGSNPVQAQDGASCTLFYVIKPGDTLNKIAQFSYGKWDYQLIFSRNVQVLKDPSKLPEGQMLMIPCANGIAPTFDLVIANQAAGATTDVALQEAQNAVAAIQQAQSELEPVVEEQPSKEPAAVEPEVVETETAEQEPTETASLEEAKVEPEAQPTPQEPSPESVVATAAPATLNSPVDKLKLLTSSGLPPFSDKSLRGGGMATELANRSLEKLGIKDASRIVFIDDRESHLQDLLIDGSFDLGFPWYRPACEEIAILEELAPDDAWLCKNFTFSEPFYEFVYGFFVPKGEYSLSRTTFDDFSEARICRPAETSVLDLAVNGLTEDEATFIRPETLSECFDLLEAGDIDAVSGEAFEAENLLAERGLFETIEELPNLGLLQTIHAVAPAGKPGSDDAIAAMNQGLIELKVSGEWFRIVGRHLAKN